MLQDTLSIAQKHIWFDRSEARDRNYVVKTLKKHTEIPDNNPILIFPEGTCINNTSVMMFKKGGFEVGATVYPVAIKYNPLFSDCFWNSSKQNFLQHIFELMTSWAVVADVWYLPPMDINEGETPIDFASRVKNLIADKGGLRDLQWDGQLKRKRVKSTYKQDIQKLYSSWIGLNDLTESQEELSKDILSQLSNDGMDDSKEHSDDEIDHEGIVFGNKDSGEVEINENKKEK